MTRQSPQAATEIPEAFGGFFDDAAIFPPGLAPLERAIADHILRREAPLDVAAGPLILPLTALAEAQALAAAHDLASGPIAVSVVVLPGDLDAARRTCATVGPELSIVAIELKTGADWRRDIQDAQSIEGVDVYVELTAAQMAEGALDAVAAAGLRLKFRTGGIHARLFPTVPELGGAILEAVARGITFKLTAGLHRAVRYTDPATGFNHHGFLNIAAATAVARNGGTAAEVEAALAEVDAVRLAGLLSVDSGGALDAAWRDSFASFGTCSVQEPAESLEELGLLAAGLSGTSAAPTTHTTS